MARSRRARRVWPWVVGAVTVLIAGGAIAAVVMLSNPARRGGTTGATTETTATAQAFAVSDFLAAYVKGDAAAIETHVTVRSRPWTAPALRLPAGVSPDAAASAIAPSREGDSLALDVPFVVHLRLTGDGKAPTGTVTTIVTRSGASAQEATVGVVLSGGHWLVDSIGGLPAAEGIARVAP